MRTPLWAREQARHEATLERNVAIATLVMGILIVFRADSPVWLTRLAGASWVLTGAERLIWPRRPSASLLRALILLPIGCAGIACLAGKASLSDAGGVVLLQAFNFLMLALMSGQAPPERTPRG